MVPLSAVSVARASYRIVSCYSQYSTVRKEGHCRSYLTSVVDPPVGVLERPCTLILAEDVGVIQGGVLSAAADSWHDIFNTIIPKDNGIAYARWSLSEQAQSFDAALDEMKSDLERVQQPVLIARGPWMSWMAQFYLESLPLAALIMVDPLQFDTCRDDICRFYEGLYAQHYNSSSDRPPPEYKLFQEYVSHWDHWMLKLERGIIPMLVLSSEQSESVWNRHAYSTAARHSSAVSPYGNVSVVQINASQTVQNRKLICDWIEENVL